MALRLEGNKTKLINYSSLNLSVISYVLFQQAMEPSLNFNISKMAYDSQHGLFMNIITEVPQLNTYCMYPCHICITCV